MYLYRFANNMTKDYLAKCFKNELEQMKPVSWMRKNLPLPLKKILRTPFWYGKYICFKLVEKLFSSGRVYYCPCCGFRFSNLMDGGYQNHPEHFNIKRYEFVRQDVICPFCYSLPRHRILANWCEQNLDSFTRKRILYFALEKSMMLWLKRNRIQVTSADLVNPAELKLDIECIDEPDNSWDIVFCNHVMEHVKDYKKALNELKRILVPGGKLICSFPIDESLCTVIEDGELSEDMSEEADRERIRRFGQKDHFRVFGLDSQYLLENAGFLVTVIDGDSMPEEICPVVGPADYDSNKLFLCEKSRP